MPPPPDGHTPVYKSRGDTYLGTSFRCLHRPMGTLRCTNHEAILTLAHPFDASTARWAHSGVQITRRESVIFSCSQSSPEVHERRKGHNFIVNAHSSMGIKRSLPCFECEATSIHCHHRVLCYNGIVKPQRLHFELLQL